MKILVEIRNVYGNATIYPANRTAEIFAAIAGTTTLTKTTLEHAVELGYDIQEVRRPAFSYSGRKYAAPWPVIS